MTRTRAAATSDFMARVVSRATGNATAIEPRLPSLFEKAPAESVGLESSSYEAENSQPFMQKQNRPEKNPEASPSLENTQSIKLQNPRTATTDIPSISPLPNFSQRQKNILEIAGSSNVEAAGKVRRSPRNSTRADSASPTPATLMREMARQPADRAFTRHLPNDQGEVETPRRALSEPPVIAGDQNFESRGFAQFGTPSSTAGDRDLESSGFAQFAAPPSASRWRPQVPQVGLPNPTTPEPVVNITIGRVEVRAAVSAASQPLPTKRGVPPLGLSDYLQGRTRSK